MPISGAKALSSLPIDCHIMYVRLYLRTAQSKMKYDCFQFRMDRWWCASNGDFSTHPNPRYWLPFPPSMSLQSGRPITVNLSYSLQGSANQTGGSLDFFNAAPAGLPSDNHGPFLEDNVWHWPKNKGHFSTWIGCDYPISRWGFRSKGLDAEFWPTLEARSPRKPLISRALTYDTSKSRKRDPTRDLSARVSSPSFGKSFVTRI